MTKPRDLANLVNPGSITGGQLAASSVTNVKIANDADIAELHERLFVCDVWRCRKRTKSQWIICDYARYAQYQRGHRSY